MTSKLASKWGRAILAAMAASLVPANVAYAEWCGAFPIPLEPNQLSRQVFPTGSFTTQGVNIVGPSSQSINVRPNAITNDLVSGDITTPAPTIFTLSHLALSEFSEGIRATYSVRWRRNNQVLTAGSAGTNWVSINPAPSTTVSLAPLQSRDYIATFNGGVLDTLSPGIYEATVTLSTPTKPSQRAALLTAPAPVSSSVQIPSRLFADRIVSGDQIPAVLTNKTFSVTHLTTTDFPAGLNLSYSIEWRKDGELVNAAEAPESRDWFRVAPAPDAGVSLTPGASQNYTVIYEPGATTALPVNELSPGLYTGRVRFSAPDGGGNQVPVGEVLVGVEVAAKLIDYQIIVAIDGSVVGRIYPLGAFSEVTDPQIYLRVEAPDAGDVNAFMQFIPSDAGDPTTVALYHGNAPGRNGFAVAPGSNRDIAILLADNAPGFDVSGAYDRSVPSVTGRWQPAKINTYIQSGVDALVASSLAEEVKFGLSEFNGKVNGSYRLVFYSDSGADDYRIIEACMLPSPTIEGDLDPRGFTLGGPQLLRVMNVTDQILSAFHLTGFEHLDTRLFAPRNSGVPSQVLPTRLLTNEGAYNPALDVNAANSLVRGFDALNASDATDYLNNFAFSLAGGYGLEFSKLDIAPASSRGDGLITVADFVQLGLYIAGIGFPATTEQDGPLSPGDRLVYLGSKDSRQFLVRGTPDSELPEIPVRLRSRGVEQTIALGIQYDPTLLDFVSARRNGREVEIPTFEIQNNNVNGIVGIEIGLRPNRTFPLTTASGQPHDPATQPIVSSTPGVFATGDGYNNDEIIAFVKFRPRAGSGTVNTELAFLQPGSPSAPLNGREPTVRIPSGAPASAFFISSGVTILDQGAAATRVRVADKVLSQGDGDPNTIPEGDALQTIDILMDATGLENATGFTLEFDREDLDVLGIRPGFSLPGSAFFLSNPDFDPVRITNSLRRDFASRTDEAGALKVLIGLQPGTTFPAGRNVIATLDVKARSLAGTGLDQKASPIRFRPLGDTLEVVDANAIPVSATFGRTGNREDIVTIVSGECSYTLTAGQVGAPVISEVQFDLNGGGGSLNVSTSTPQCNWTASINYQTPGQINWVTLSGFPDAVQPGLGGGRITFEVAPYNGAVTRTATINLLDQSVRIVQTGCSVTASLVAGVSPTEAAFTGLGGAGTIEITAAAPNCPSTVLVEYSGGTLAPWIEFPSEPTSGIGSRIVTFRVKRNEGEARIARIIVGETVLTVRQDFNFATSAEGWELFPGFQTEDFTFATGGFERQQNQDSGRLSLTTANNTNTFGFFTSPVFNISNSADSLFRATFRVTSNVARQEAPTFRLRASTGDFSKTAELQVESFAVVDPTTPLAPDATGNKYEHYFSVPSNQNSLRLYFDVINFDQLNAPIAKVSLESMAVTSFVRSQALLNRRTDLAGLVAATTEFQEFIVRPYPVREEFFAPPVFLRDARGASIRSSEIDPLAYKTSVGMITAPTGVTLEGNRLYEVVFQVSSRSQSATTIRKDKVPTFRVRVNESSLQLASLVNIESIDENSVVPTFLQNQRYSVWFPSQQALAGRELIVSLDYIYTPEFLNDPGTTSLIVPESLNDPGIAIVLERVEIYSYDRPGSN